MQLGCFKIKAKTNTVKREPYTGCPLILIVAMDGRKCFVMKVTLSLTLDFSFHSYDKHIYSKQNIPFENIFFLLVKIRTDLKQQHIFLPLETLVIIM